MQDKSISIIEFSVENYRIFKKKVTFSMLAKKSKHTFEKKRQNLLKTSLIYGPNASGKSTLMKAFILLKTGIINSANEQKGADLPYHPFALSNESNQPVFCEVVFVLGNSIFKYNFSILKDRVVTENLYKIMSSGEEKKYLIRKKQNIKLFKDFEKSEDVIAKTRKEVLFLSAAYKWNNALARVIFEGFEDVNVISGPKSDDYLGYTIKLFKEDTDMKNKILNLLKKADFCIEDGIIEGGSLYFTHNKFDSKNNKIGTERFNIDNESDGTQRFFAVIGLIIDTLENGKVLFIDEFDNSLHPLLTKLIIDLFENNNPHNAQLIVTTHDTNLLTYKDDFSKDQFWFTEKDKYGAGNLFSLAEFNMGLRNNTEYSKKYLEGRFGALPFIESV